MSQSFKVSIIASLIGATIGNIIWWNDPSWSAWTGWLSRYVGF
jgi:hypothetical protein